jgi:hypothetical protein
VLLFPVVVASGDGGILLLQQRFRWWIFSGSSPAVVWFVHCMQWVFGF